MSGALTHSPMEIMEQLMSNLSLGTLVSAGGTWPIYRTILPDTPDNCLRLKDSERQITGRNHVTKVVEESYGIQVSLRSATPATGRDKIEAIRATFDTSVFRTTVTIGAVSYRVNSIRRVSGPLEVGHFSAADRRILFTLNVYVNVEQL